MILSIAANIPCRDNGLSRFSHTIETIVCRQKKKVDKFVVSKYFSKYLDLESLKPTSYFELLFMRSSNS